MIIPFYKVLTGATRLLGRWLFILVSRIIAAGYFVFLPSRAAISVRFYRALYPEKSFIYHLRCSWKQYQNFTTVFLDRVLLEHQGKITYTSEGWEKMNKAVAEKLGGIILTSHMGNWDVAAHFLKKRGLRMLIYMGRKQKEKLEKVQKENLAEAGLTIVAVDSEAGSPFDIIEGVRFIKDGGLVALSGDRLWRKDQRSVRVGFLGRHALLPEAPHRLALLTGAPIFIFFTYKTGRDRYHFQCQGPFYLSASERSGRKQAIEKSAELYAGILEEQVREHPLEWYHFEQFLED